MASTRPDTKYLATRSQEEVLAQLGSSLARGLSADEVSRRLEKEGYNEITANQVRWWEIALRQFRSAFIYLLLVAAVIVILIGEYVDGVVILGFVLVNALLGFYQEYRSEQALQALQQF
ncbi:MAG TPA: ATPase P, partial [Methanolinea sp.]|nr:ATPase P [Methanolinea sp.]